MEPLLREGDVLELAALPEPPRPGNVYAFRFPELVLHRCVGKQEDWQFRGDRQPRGETVAKTTDFFPSPRLLSRASPPPAWEIAFGLSALACRAESIPAPKNASLYWPWEKIFALCLRHNFLSLFAYGLKRTGLWEECPYQEILAQALQEDVLRAEKISATIAELDALFPQKRFLKGAALRALYPEPFLRVMGDVDVLVDEKAYQNSAQALAQKGFRWTKANQEIASFYHQTTLTSESTGICVEVHRSLFQENRYAFDSQPFLQGTESRAEQIAYLCAHAVTHWGRHGQSVLDIYLLLEQEAPDSASLLLAAQKTKSQLAMAFVLAGVDAWWNRDYAQGVEHGLSLWQRAKLWLAKEFFLHQFELNLYGFPKKVLQYLVSDGGFLRLYMDSGRRRMAVVD